LEHKKPLLRLLSVVLARRLAGLKDVDVEAEVRESVRGVFERPRMTGLVTAGVS
jgi:hypothetical protein